MLRFGADDMTATPTHDLPPGQRARDTFPRFGVHFADPPPDVPAEPAIEVRGAVAQPFAIPLARLEELPRRTVVADFHCVAGWSVRDLRWEGVAFRALWEEAIEPSDQVTHLTFTGLDGFRSVLLLEDALAGDVLVADRLDGAPLDGDHGAPARLVTPRQYGYMNTKHLCRIELHPRAPSWPRHASRLRSGLLVPVAPHPRARVDREERHARLPGWAVRDLYRRVILPILTRRMG